MRYSPLIERLMEDLRCLPGVGPKSAQRMAFSLLENNRESAKRLAHTLLNAVEQIGHCDTCRTLTETTTCPICASDKRNRRLLCIVETPVDVHAIEQATNYSGLYFVLMGHLSPLDGIGPQQIGLDLLETRLKAGEIDEVILATNPTVEGEATAHYISEMVHSHRIRATRIAHGIPIGGELEFVDGGMLSYVFNGRRDM